MKVETFTFKDWTHTETGVVLAENEDWILINHIPSDYLIDGYKLYKKKFVKSRKSKKIEKQIAAVLKLKKAKCRKPKKFKFGKTIDLLKWVEKKYGYFEFQDDIEGELFYGKVNEVDKKSLFIDLIDAQGRVDEACDLQFKINKIRTITFDTDYFRAIGLLMNN